MDDRTFRQRAEQAERLSRQVPEPDRARLLAIAAEFTDQADREKPPARDGEASA